MFVFFILLYCYIVQVICTTKRIKNKANILQKTALQSMSQMRLILIPIWLPFGRDLGLKSEPNRYKIALNIASQDEQQDDTLWDGLKIDF